ncbi:DUF4190 domain-containing protein [Amycolatopsis suaedae]|uniref:DUF4190 domain-containing protein n=2 Tax=Amycolatopsis suaedae TaxID=2510978 RepID=A0A4Q7J7I5_9PSEU|nr:DUF4190 domain-containing protein [Amycolatopsis suaedae]
MPPQNQDSGMAVGSLVCSIVGLVACGGLLSIVGIILGHIALSKAKRGEAGGRGMALAGVIIGYVAIGLVLLTVIIVVIIGISTNWRGFR